MCSGVASVFRLILATYCNSCFFTVICNVLARDVLHYTQCISAARVYTVLVSDNYTGCSLIVMSCNVL